MPATKAHIFGGAFQDSEGNPLANGTLKCVLSQDGVVPGVGSICAGIAVTLQLDANGNITQTPSQFIWGNDVIVPLNATFYKVTGYTAQGQPAWGPNNQQVTGSSFDAGTWIPNTVFQWNPPIQPITLEVNGSPASSQILQNLESGTGVTVTDLGGGNVRFDGSSTLSVEINGTPTSNQSLINLESSDASVTITNPSGGIIDFKAAGATKGPMPSDFDWHYQSMISQAMLNVGGPGASLNTGPMSGTTSDIAPTATEPAHFQSAATHSSEICGAVENQAAAISLGILNVWQVRCVTPTNGPRYWFGMSDAGASAIGAGTYGTDTPNANTLAFRYSTSAGDTFWQCVAGTDNTHLTVTPTTVAPDISSVSHVFQIKMISGVANFYIDGVLVGQVSTNLPATNVALRTFLTLDTNAGGSSGTLGMAWYYWDSLV